MHEFTVWAPLPQKVEIQIGGKRHDMLRGADGWWTARVGSAGPGCDYGYVLDGEGPFPDPRSAWQPASVHGLSRLVDQAAFIWTDGGWQAPPLSSAVIYEMHVGTFSPAGTFAGVIDRLDHLLGLGVTHVELMPVAEFSGKRGWGYDGVDLFAPCEAYGGPEGLKRLVDACHARRLAVILDVVYNHLGPSGNYLAKYGTYFASRFSTPWGAGINFDGAHSDEVRKYFCDNALMWLRDYHFDGLRLDAVHAILDTSATPFLEQLASEVKELEAALGRHFVLIAESDLNDPRLVWPQARGGIGLDAQWNDDFHHALHAVLTSEQAGYYADFGTLADFGKALQGAYVYDGGHSKFRCRRHGRPIEGLSGHHFLAYLQNHDQIGNRAMGERTGGLMSVDRLKIGAALVFTSPFVPMIFQGEEWAASTPFLYFTDYREPELANGMRTTRSNEFSAFGWKAEELPDPQSVETFERSKLNWSEATRPLHAEMLDWHRRLIQLRHEEPSLTDGRLDRLRVNFNEEEHWLTIERGAITVICNLGEHARDFSLRPGKHRMLLVSDSAGTSSTDDQVGLPANAVAILKLENGK